jgi:acetylornithine deacetylase
MTATEAHLDRLIAMPTVSRDSNLEFIAYLRDTLSALGIASQLVPSEDGRKANLFATIGPPDRPGIVLSGHTDVVPVEGQAWTSDPFRMVERDGKFYGRGSADMKGFIAACLAMAPAAIKRDLKVPIHFAFSYDEEVGCLGVRRLISMLKDVEPRPRMVIIGEPTSLQAVTAHKGKLGRRVVAHGLEAHSSLAPIGVNAIYMISDLIAEIRAIQDEVAYTTLQVGTIEGGQALNIVPNRCEMDYEIRHLPADDAEAILQWVEMCAEAIAARSRKVFPQARFEFTALPSYPALDTPVDSEAVNFVRRLTGGNSTGKISFGTEGGLFTRDLGVPAVVCGPGSIAVAHKPDEYIAREQLALCDQMLARLIDELAI